MFPCELGQRLNKAAGFRYQLSIKGHVLLYLTELVATPLHLDPGVPGKSHPHVVLGRDPLPNLGLNRKKCSSVVSLAGEHVVQHGVK